MLPQIKYLPVNWMDGMKISDRHFIQLEHSITDRLRDVSASTINDFNYGLLPPSPGMRSALDLQFYADQANLIRVKLNECRAITGGGVRIEISAGSNTEFKAFHKEIEASYSIKKANVNSLDIVVVVNPFSLVPSGTPDPDEIPIRYPYALPEYRLEIVPSEQINQNQSAAFSLIVGRIKVLGDEIALDESFIPPCTTIQCYRPLEESYEYLRKQLFELGSAAMAITQKIRSEPKKTELAVNILYIAEKVLSYLSMVIPQHRMTIMQGPPILMFEKLSSLGYVISAAVNCTPDKEREKMFNYWKQWIEMSQSQFENAVMGVMNIEYNHLNIAPALQSTTKFVNVIVKLFKQLSKLKYIGEQKDSGIVIGETFEPVTRQENRPEPVVPKEKPKAGGWSFLTD